MSTETDLNLIGGGFGGRGETSAIMNWVQANGTTVSIDGSPTQLYDLSSLQAS